jgi:hypothetical protein
MFTRGYLPGLGFRRQKQKVLELCQQIGQLGCLGSDLSKLWGFKQENLECKGNLMV